MTSLELILVYLFAAVLGVVVFRSFRLPPMLGYLVVGVLIGPHTLGMVHSSTRIAHLAEFGVVLLMFLIGLEFNLPKLRAMRAHVFGLGLAQVGLTMLGAVAASWALGALFPRLWPLGWQATLALSGTLAMSSTAIVVKLMAERLELETPHGQRVMGVLLFQDLAVVPLLILIPALGAGNDDMAGDLLIALGKALLLIGLLLTAGPWVMNRWLTIVARRKTSELFMLNVLLVTLALAWLTDKAGLSLPLGAFIAGMLIAETPYKHQVDADIRPFHDLLLGLFFITIGMMLDWREVLNHWPLVLLLVTAPVLFKLAVVVAGARLLGASSGVALRTGLYLAQAGEFGFVLLNLTLQNRLLPAPLFSAILASMVISMMTTPFIILYSNAIVARLARGEWFNEALQMTHIARRSIDTHQHVIICGYGRSGQKLARMLSMHNVPYVALDIDPDHVRQASAAGDGVVYGDAGRLAALMAAGLKRASALVVTFPETPQALRVLDLVRQHAPQIPVMVRTRDDRDLEKLRRAGATEVVPEALEGSLILASHVLALAGVPLRRVLRSMQQQRGQRYELLRGAFFRNTTAYEPEEDLQCERLHSFTVTQGARCCGMHIVSLRAMLESLDVRLISLRRAGAAYLLAQDDTQIQANDTLVLSGKPAELSAAELRMA